MEPIDLDDVRERHRTTDEPYHEFLRVPAMSLGRYALEAGATDPQSPHGEDEVYLVLDGRATIQIADERYPVEPGDVVYVERNTDHRFVDIEADLEVVVFFAPAEGTAESEP